MKKIFLPWFRIDSRSLGIYRILLGWVCFIDIIRRWSFIDVFYSDQAIQTKIDSKFFNIFHYIGNGSFEVHLIFIIGIFFSITLMIGYKTKISHFITSIIIIGIHGQVVVVGNSGDTFLNTMLMWTLFLPLGQSISIDSLLKSLKNFKESKVEDLNDRSNGINKPIQVFSIAYFAVLLQITAIYFLTALHRTTVDYESRWADGTAFYYMHHLDGFITSFGYFIRDYINMPISKLLTYSTLYLEYIVPMLLFFPFYNHISRLVTVIALTILHLMIRLSMHVGLFSQIMISTFPLLIDKKIIDYIKSKLEIRYKKNQFTLFYDSDCGFCHYTVRIIKRLDIFNRIIFSDGNSNVKKPKNFNNLADKTAILFNSQNNTIWTRHHAFGKILSLLPLGFFVSWIFFIPFLSTIFGFIYDNIAKNRTKISIFFGLPACNLPQSESSIENIDTQQVNSFILFKSLIKLFSPILIIIMLSASIYSALINHKLINGINWSNNPTLEIINRIPRMIQRWTMFESVPVTEQIIILEANLDNGDEKINPFTGQKAILNSADYTIIMKNKSQLWRKYFEWIGNQAINLTKTTNKNEKQIKNSKKNLLEIKNNFIIWILNPHNTYFDKKLNGRKIKSVEIWRVSQAAPRMDNKKYLTPISATIFENKAKWTD